MLALRIFRFERAGHWSLLSLPPCRALRHWTIIHIDNLIVFTRSADETVVVSTLPVVPTVQVMWAMAADFVTGVFSTTLARMVVISAR